MATRHRPGTAIVELALVLPIFLTLLLGVADIGFIYNHQLILTNAAREGARGGALGDTEAQIRTSVTTYLQTSGYTPLPPASDIAVVFSEQEALVTIHSTVPFLFGSSGAPITLKAATRMRRDS